MKTEHAFVISVMVRPVSVLMSQSVGQSFVIQICFLTGSPQFTSGRPDPLCSGGYYDVF